MIRALARLADGSVRRDIPCGDIAALRADPRVILWVDCTPDGVGEEQEERTLLEQFGFHPLAVDDALRETNIPKVDDWHDYIYVVLHAVRFESNIAAISAHELDLFVGRNFLVSHHTEPIPPLEQIWKSVGSEPRRLAGGCDNLLYQIADSIVADYMPLVDGIDDWIDQVEDEVFEKPSPETLARIFHQKRTREPETQPRGRTRSA
jgi:magnesium transporter